jgi:hypothetical protein
MKILNCPCGGKGEIPETYYLEESQALVVCSECGKESLQWSYIKNAVNNWNRICIVEHCIRDLCEGWDAPGFTIKRIAKRAGASYYMAKKHINALIAGNFLATKWFGGCDENGPVRPIRLILSTQRLRWDPLYQRIEKEEAERFRKSWEQ